MLFKIGVLENFAIFTGKHLCWILFLLKLQAWRPEGLYLYSPLKIAKFLRRPFFIEHFWWLLMELISEIEWQSPRELKNFAKSTGKRKCLSLFSHSVLEIPMQLISCEFCEILNLRTLFYRTPPGDCFLRLQNIVEDWLRFRRQRQRISN